VKREAFLQQLRDEARGLEGPTPHESLPLLEWRSPTQHIPVLYAPLDVFERDVHSNELPSGGLYLSCPFNGQTDPNHHVCWAGAVVTPQLSLRYRIYRADVPDWLEIQEAMESLVQGFIVPPEQENNGKRSSAPATAGNRFSRRLSADGSCPARAARLPC
jgi:hypothetical protein